MLLKKIMSTIKTENHLEKNDHKKDSIFMISQMSHSKLSTFSRRIMNLSQKFRIQTCIEIL